jgi:agmatinase
MENFNPNDIGIANGNYFGLPYSIDESEIVLVSVPWDATVSYSDGTAQGPQAIIDASLQVDLFDEAIPNAWLTKVGTHPIDEEIESLNNKSRETAIKVIESLEVGQEPEPELLKEVNDASCRVNKYVEELSGSYLEKGKVVGVVGGEHSVPFGLIKALAAKNEEFGVLHIDAHADLREAYEGFEYSHASIMYNTISQIPQVTQLTQVAVRDFCSDEWNIMQESAKVTSFTDREIANSMFEGKSWKEICIQIVSTLPDKVYVSFDIDGLSPDLCPNTGTPVPGGMSFRQADYLLETIVKQGKKIIGFDLCEVASAENGEWDANVGARVLFKLCCWTRMSL